jgi:predicted transcriptional regulator
VDVGAPYRSVAPGLEGDVLVVLARIRAPLSGRQVAARIPGASQDGVQKVLDRLVHHGLVHREVAGRAFMHTLDREHVAADAAVALAGLRDTLWQRMREGLARWEVPPVHASVFGSAARGDGDADSDVDVFLVRPADVDEDDELWRAQVARWAAAGEAWTGNALSVVEQDERELAELVAAAPPVLDDLRTDAVHLLGPPIRELLAAPRAT